MALRAMVLVGIRDSAVVKVASSWLVDVCFLYKAYRLYGFLGTKKGILASPIYG